MSEPRRTFVPVLLLGLGSTVLTTVASGRTWLEYTQRDPRVLEPVVPGGDAGQMPLATALGLVLLACWGVLLVTRRLVRRLVAVLGLACAVGVVAVVVAAWFLLPDQRPEPDALPAGAAMAGLRWTAWYWTAAAGSLGSLVAAVLAVRRVRHWPEMGSRYDAPGAAERSEPEEASSLDLWKAMDEGRDPTA